MILLSSQNDQLQVITSSVASVDIHATWVDTKLDVGQITPGRTNTHSAAAATVSIAGSPDLQVQRNVKTIHVRNKDASLACDITLQHTDGTTLVELYKTTLSVGGAFEYTDHGGFTGLRG